jgi:hypothetical protein
MPQRHAAAVVVLALATLAASCGTSPRAPRTAPAPGSYVDTVQALLDPVARFAQAVAGQLGPEPPPRPSAAEIDRLVRRTDEGIAALRALPLEDPGLRAQRDALAGALVVVLGHMRELAQDLERGDRRALRADARPFFVAIRRLPSDAHGSPRSR